MIDSFQARNYYSFSIFSKTSAAVKPIDINEQEAASSRYFEQNG